MGVGRENLPAALRDRANTGGAARQRFALTGTPHLAVAVSVPAIEAVYFEVFPLTRLASTLGVLRNSPSTTSTTAAVPRVTVEVFFVAGDRLTTVRREVAAAAVLSTALDAVEAGPSDAEAAAGLRNALPEDAVTRVSSSSSVAHVDLAASFAAVDPAEQLLAIAQIVFTASAVTGVDSVAFSVEGRPAEVPIDGASLVSRAVGRSDYASVAPVP